MATRASAIRRSSVIFLAAASVLALAKSASADFKPLGDLSGGAFYSYPTAISADGQIIVGYSISDTGMQGFTWSGFGPSLLSDLTGVNLLPTGISSNGGVIVGSVNNRAARWSGSGIETLPGFATSNSVATGVSADGGIVVGYVDQPTGRTSFRWTSDGQVDLFPNSTFYAISGDAQVIAGNNDANQWTQWVGSPPAPQPLGANSSSLITLPDQRFAVSRNGFAIVGSRASGAASAEATRWDQNSGAIDLGFLTGDSLSHATAISADALRIVGFSSDGTESRAFRWDAIRGMQDLKQALLNDDSDEWGQGPLASWQLTSATGISADGRSIIGVGINPDGNTEAWMADRVFPALRNRMNFTWAGASGGSIDDPANWSPYGGPPTPIDNAIFNSATVHSISLSQDTNHGRLIIRNDQVNLNLNSFSYHAITEMDPDNGPGALCVGCGGAGTLTLTNGNWDSFRYSVVGVSEPYNPDAPGVPGNGTFIIGAGVKANLEELWVGWDGIGKAIFRDGADVFAFTVTIARDAGSDGSLTITGSNTKATTIQGSPSSSRAGGSSVGEKGHGELIVADGASFESGSGVYIGGYAGASGLVQVSGAGTRLIAADRFDSTFPSQIQVGISGEGQLRISDGAIVHAAGNVSIAANVGAHGEVSVAGNGARLEASDTLVIGGHGLYFYSDTDKDPRAGGSGLLTVGSGGTVQVTNWVRAYAAGIVDLDGGTITTPRLELVGGQLTGNGRISGDLINGGQVSPGHSIGAITAASFAQSADGLLVMEIAAVGAVDRLLVGNSNLAGSLDVAFIDGFLPHSGDQFKLIDGSGSITGQFTSIDIGGVGPGFEYRLSYSGGDVILTALNDASPVPEPAALGVIPIGLLLIRRRSRTDAGLFTTPDPAVPAP